MGFTSLLLQTISQRVRPLVHVRGFHTNYCLNHKKRAENWGKNKLQRYKPLYVNKIMAEIDPEIARILEPLRQSVKEQGLYQMFDPFIQCLIH